MPFKDYSTFHIMFEENIKINALNLLKVNGSRHVVICVVFRLEALLVFLFCRIELIENYSHYLCHV